MSGTTDLFIRTYRGDVGWLKYCLRSIQKHAEGFRRVVIAIPEEQRDALRGLNLTAETVVGVPAYRDDYLGQQATKLTAYKHTDADWIMFLDSDCVLTTRVSPDLFFSRGRPVIYKTHYDHVDAKHWKGVTEKAVGFAVEYEYMRRHPMTYARQTLISLDAYLKGRHGMTAEEYALSQPQHQLSEFNVMGAYAERFEPDRYHFHDTALGIEPARVRQFWSWGGLTEAIKNELEKALYETDCCK